MPFFNMFKFLKKINHGARKILGFFGKLILGIVYFFLFFPIGFTIRFFTDFLDTKSQVPCWVSRDSIKDVKSFLNQQ